MQAEAQAKQKRLGFWNQPSPVMPWKFRHSKRSNGDRAFSNSIPPVSPQAQTNQLPTCVNSDCNCSDFKTRAQAQQVLEAFPNDPFGLDGERDGVACESLP